MTAPQKQTQGSTVFPTCSTRIPPLPMPRPRMASPQRAAHVLGSPTGRRSSPGGRRSWGRGRGRPVCRSSRVRTWGTPFSCLQTSTKRQGTASYYSFWQDGAGGSCHPAHTRACAKVAACLRESQTRAAATTPRSGGTKIFTNQVHVPSGPFFCRSLAHLTRTNSQDCPGRVKSATEAVSRSYSRRECR